LIFIPVPMFAQDDHDHSHGGHDHSSEAMEESPKLRRIAESTSSKYEVVISYGDVHSNEESTLNIFISDMETNAALDSLNITLRCPDMNNKGFELKSKEKGFYEFKVSFPKDGYYDFHVDLDGPKGSATLVLRDVVVGGHTHDEAEHTDTEAWYKNPWVAFLGGVVLMLLVFFFINRAKGRRTLVVMIIFMVVSSREALSPALMQAQDDGHDHSHGASSNAKSLLTDEFSIQKETQFLFEILTSRIRSDSFKPARKIMGRVIAAPNGFAEVHVSQTAQIESVNVKVGQRVEKGQLLATVKLLTDAASQTSFQAALHEAEFEYAAAKKEVDRLKLISDIASKKQQEEAMKRFQIADENRKLLASGGSRSMILKAPIAGVVEPFSVSPGGSAQAGELLFSVSNSAHVLIEAQVFDGDMEAVRNATGFMAQCTDARMSSVKLDGVVERLNPVNQSQVVIFSLDNAEGILQIGEFVSVFALESGASGNQYVPNAAMNEINGKPVVFVKESAEKFRIEYVSIGRDNGLYTEILNGLNEGELVITGGSYQMKMIFLNQ